MAEAGQTLRAGCSLPCPNAAPVCCRRAAAAQPAPAIAYNADYAREWRALVSGRVCPLLRIIRPALYEGTGPPAIAGGGSLPFPGAAPVCALPLAAAARRRGRSAACGGREAQGWGAGAAATGQQGRQSYAGPFRAARRAPVFGSSRLFWLRCCSPPRGATMPGVPAGRGSR